MVFPLKISIFVEQLSLMKNLRLIVLLIFLNFTALPSIASIFDFDIPTPTIVFEEEEENHSTYCYEKRIPQSFNINDFINNSMLYGPQQNLYNYRNKIHINPYIQRFLPPPEFI